MLQNIRDNATGWMAKIIVGFIIITFAFFGIESLRGIGGGNDSVASVNGEEISRIELEQAVQRQTQRLLAQLGPDADPSMLDENLLRGSVLEGLIERAVLLQAAQEDGFHFSDRQIDQMILTTPEFQVDGRFDRDRFTSVLRNVGMTPLQFRNAIRQDMLINQLQSGLVGSSFAIDPDVERLARLDRQTRDIAYLRIPVADMMAQVEVSDAEVRAYYDENSTQFMSPEQVAIEYLLLERSALEEQIHISDEQLQQAYERRVAELSEQEERRAAHILVEVNESTDEEAARRTLEEAAKRLAQGADFAQLAQELSDDVGSAEQGGELGYVTQGMFDPAFEEALFALQAGEVSEPVRTEYGYHLIKLLEIRKPEAPTFEELKPELMQTLREQRSRERFVEQAEELANLSFAAADLNEPADAMGLVIQQSPLFSREGGDGITAERKVIEAAFSTEVLEQGHNSDLIELPGDRAVVLRVKEHIEPAVQSFAEVEASIKTLLKERQARDLAQQQADALLQQLRETGDKASVASASNYTWVTHEKVQRQGDGIPPQIARAAFKLPQPSERPFSADVMSLANGDAVVLMVTAVQPGDATSLSEAEQASIKRFLSNRNSNQELQALREQLSTEAEIERL